MSDKTLKRLEKLSTIAELVKDAALGDLARAVQLCEATRRNLRALEAPMPPDALLPLPVLESAALMHQRWSEPRRRRLLEDLALQTAKRIECEAIARRALGRAEVISQLRQAQRDRRG